VVQKGCCMDVLGHDDDRTLFQVELTWEEVCDIAASLVNRQRNEQGPQFRRDLAYVAELSIGGRKVVDREGNDVTERRDLAEEAIGLWLGWPEDQIKRLVFTSATSGAELDIMWDEPTSRVSLHLPCA